MTTRVTTQQGSVTPSSCSTTSQPGRITTGSYQTLNNGTFRDRVAQRAYEKWMRRGRQHGNDKQDWFEAERELLAEQARLNNAGLSYYR